MLKLPQPSNIIEAWETCFRPVFGRDLSSWRAWQSFVKPLYGLPFKTEEEALLFQLGTLREKVPEGGFSEAYCVCGRRGGKSRVTSLIAGYEALFGGWREKVAPGERVWIFCIATDKSQAKIVLSYILALLHLFDDPKAKAKGERSLVENETMDEVHLRNGVSIAVKPCTYRAARGFTTCMVIMDELAFWRDENSANPAAEVVTSILPGLLPGGRLIGISTPYAKFGFLWQTFKDHYGKDGSDILVWKADTLTMNPCPGPGFGRRVCRRVPRGCSSFPAA
jgi:hypothetical protein